MPSIVWKGQLTFGLVTIPVKLLRAARRERIRMHYVHREDHALSPPVPADSKTIRMEPRPSDSSDETPDYEMTTVAAPITRVRQSLVSPGDEQPISRDELEKAYEVEPDRYVVFDRDELRHLRRRTSQTMEIIRSVHLPEIDPVFLDNSYYVLPDRGGENSYSILFVAMRETEQVALARVGMHGREHVVIVRPGKHGLLAHTMFYTDEIRSESEYRTNTAAVGAKELKLAKTFLDALRAPFAPEEFKDQYREELQAMVADKMRGQEVLSGPQKTPAAAPVVDILDALKRSIAMAQSSGSDDRPARKTPSRVTPIKSKRLSSKRN